MSAAALPRDTGEPGRMSVAAPGHASWAIGLAVAAALHLGLLFVLFFAAVDDRRPQQAPEGVMISLDALEAGPTARAKTAPAVEAPQPGPEPAQPAEPAAAVAATPAVPAVEPVAAAPAAIGPEPAPTPIESAAASARDAPERARIADGDTPDAAVPVAPIAANAVAADRVTGETRPRVVDAADAQDATEVPANGAFGDSSQTTRDYILRLRAWLSRHKQYPMAAREAGIEGNARLYLAIAADGRVLERRIVETAGSRLLDEAALAMVDRAAPLPRMDAAMQRNRIEVVVPVIYSLGD